MEQMNFIFFELFQRNQTIIFFKHSQKQLMDFRVVNFTLWTDLIGQEYFVALGDVEEVDFLQNYF